MPTSGDDHFLYALTRMPVKVLEYQQRLGYKPFIPQSADKIDDPDSIFFSRGPLATIRIDILLFIIDRLPENQRRLYYWLMLLSYQNLMRQVYVVVYVEAFFLWYWPAILPSRIYYITVVGDSFVRTWFASRGVFVHEIVRVMRGQLFWLWTTLNGLDDYLGPIDLASLLESVLGSTDLWSTAVLPVAIGLLHDDGMIPLNAFTPEGAGGIFMALAIWTLSKTAWWLQWMVWPVYSCPKAKIVVVKWALCTLVWIWYGIPPQVGYGLFLFTNQFPEAEYALRKSGGDTPMTLRWERYGCICYIVTSIFLESFKTLIPLTVWLLLVGIYWLKHIRVKSFKYRPLQHGWIRLLRLRALSIGGEIQCDLIHVSLDSPPKYTAISYRWGSSNDLQTIQVDGAPLRISKSIHTLLLAKRQSRHHVLLWVDSICIDQNNTVEKNQQVSLMRKIYEEAHSTIAWLGDDPGSKKAMDLVRSLSQARKVPEREAGWDELLKLFANHWFERSWIIQEIAASTNPVLRYGKEEVKWDDLMDALSLIITHSSTSGFPEETVVNHNLVNALVIENARICVENVDFLCLEDILKLGIVFKATLPVDKVFALLGVAEQRSHIDFSVWTPNSEYWHAKNLFKELDVTVHAISSLQGTLEGYINSRRSRKILAHPNGLRQLKGLKRYETQITRELLLLAEKNKSSNEKSNVEYDVLRPEYSQNLTPESVYTLVAKNALRKGEHSIMRHAGIGWKRSPALKSLPSWAPDWTSELDAYTLPFHTIVGIGKSDETDLQSKNEPLRLANFYLHPVRGVVMGRIRHLAHLKEEPSFSGNVFEAAEQDLQQQILNYNMAFTSALLYCSSFYQTQDATTNAFLQATFVLGKDSPSLTSNAPLTDCRLHIAAKLNVCNISAALWPEKHPDFWKDYVRGSESITEARKQICRRYISFRRVQASSDAKFIHMIKTEVLPSFNQYRWPSDKKQSSDPSSINSRTGSRGLSFFTDGEHNLLSAYNTYVDYTIGRKFAILESGLMGLVPWGAQKGDIVVQPQNETLCLTLRESVPPIHHMFGRTHEGQKWAEQYTRQMECDYMSHFTG